jgi:hypothetical protein
VSKRCLQPNIYGNDLPTAADGIVEVQTEHEHLLDASRNMVVSLARLLQSRGSPGPNAQSTRYENMWDPGKAVAVNSLTIMAEY